MNSVAPSAELHGLYRKYQEILALRLAPSPDSAAVRPRMAKLASQFPGALRELDDLELVELQHRSAALQRVLRGDAEIELWMRAAIRFHALARGALSAKRWLAGTKLVDPRVERAYADALPTLAFAQDAREWCGDLACIARPSAGRLTNSVFARLANELGVTRENARTLVFGTPRHARLRVQR